MKICPNRKLELISSLTKLEVSERFKRNIDFTDQFPIIGMRRHSFYDYEGYIKNDKLKFRRILKYGFNSFIPQVNGIISQTKNGTRIQLHARLHNVIRGMIITFNCLFLILITIILGTIHDNGFGGSMIMLIFPVFMLVISYVMTSYAFNNEIDRLTSDFRSLMDCKV